MLSEWPSGNIHFSPLHVVPPQTCLAVRDCESWGRLLGKVVTPPVPLLAPHQFKDDFLAVAPASPARPSGLRVCRGNCRQYWTNFHGNHTLVIQTWIFIEHDTTISGSDFSCSLIVYFPPARCFAKFELYLNIWLKIKKTVGILPKMSTERAH